MESNKQEKSNLLSDNPIAAQAGGSWLSKHMGSALQSKGSALYHTSTGHGKHVSPERSHSDGKGGTYSSHSHDTQSQKRKDKKMTKKQEGGATKNTSIKGTRANTEDAAAKAKK